MIDSPGSDYVVTPNPEIVWLARRDSSLKSAIDSASIVLPDGIGVIYGAKILGRRESLRELERILEISTLESL